MKETTQLAFGIPVWELHSCEICGSVLLPQTLAKHAEYHAISGTEPAKKTMPKKCPDCDLVINIEINYDGSMDLDEYDNHLDSHEDTNA